MHLEASKTICLVYLYQQDIFSLKQISTGISCEKAFWKCLFWHKDHHGLINDTAWGGDVSRPPSKLQEYEERLG